MFVLFFLGIMDFHEKSQNPFVLGRRNREEPDGKNHPEGESPSDFGFRVRLAPIRENFPRSFRVNRRYSEKF